MKRETALYRKVLVQSLEKEFKTYKRTKDNFYDLEMVVKLVIEEFKKMNRKELRDDDA